jgi:hypothetical protein
LVSATGVPQTIANAPDDDELLPQQAKFYTFSTDEKETMKANEHPHCHNIKHRSRIDARKLIF